MLHIATFNLHHGFRLPTALAIARDEPAIGGADVLSLQECDVAAAEAFAKALGMEPIYHPTAVHPRTGRDFGPALLTRWPVAEHSTLPLPHTGLHGLERSALRATLQVRGRQVRTWAVHFGTMREVLPFQQTAQVRTVLDAAARDGDPSVVAGDLNRKGLGRLFEAAGWRWVTRDVGPTHHFFSFDHVFLRGLSGHVRQGSVREALAASDHRAVWAAVEFPEVADWPA